MRIALLFAAAFLASAVEMVEALTIVLAVGLTRGWRSTLAGAGAAAIVLAALVGALGPALTLVPIDALRLVVGGVLLAFGLQWLRKAILRAGGCLAHRDEDRIYERERERARRAADGERAGLDWYSFTIAFKGVLLEGLEVALVVVAFAADRGGSVAITAAAAGAAIVLVAGAGLLVRAPLGRLPENTLKLAVGLMLTTFGTFWGGEGAGVSWPGGDAAIPVVLAFYLAVSAALVRLLRRDRLVAA